MYSDPSWLSSNTAHHETCHSGEGPPRSPPMHMNSLDPVKDPVHHPSPFDSGFSIPASQNSVPMPGAYEDFQYSFSNPLSGYQNMLALSNTDSPFSPTTAWLHSPPPLHGGRILPSPSPRNPAFAPVPASSHESSIDPSMLFSALPPSSSVSPKTPPPLFDRSEQDLFTTWLDGLVSDNLTTGGGGEGGFEWSFNPQGMPEGMPVLGELKRRLELEEENSKAWERRLSGATREGDEMGREVGERLRLTDHDLDALGDAGSERKRQKTESNASKGSDEDHVMLEVKPGPSAPPAPTHRKPRRSSNRAAKRPAPPSPPQPAVLLASARPNGAAPSPDASSLPKPQHLLSEQKRRSAIQGGFGALVAILHAGEAASGISIGTASNPPAALPGSTAGSGPAKKSARGAKGTGRGRGRRGEVETGASKSVVLERAVEYVKWMDQGNDALRGEVERIERMLTSQGVRLPD